MPTNTTPWEIRITRDDAEGWALKDSILLLDEIGLETDSRKFKIGNGILPWHLLPYGSLSGPDGILVFISEDDENLLEYGSDGGLFVRREAVPNLLALYILAKS